MRRSPDVTSLVSGICVAALGVLLLLDGTGAFDLRFSVLAPAACGDRSDPGGVRDEPPAMIWL